MPLRDTPIRRKLMGSILATSVVVMLLVQAAFFTYDILAARQGTQRQLNTLGTIIAANATASLAFQNRQDAQEILGALKANQRVVAAAIYDQNGQLFAHYPLARAADSFPPASAADGLQFQGWHLLGVLPISEHDRRLGTLYMDFDTAQSMRERLRDSLLVAFGVTAVALLVAYLLSRTLQQQISRPVLALAGIVADITTRQDFSVRAVKHGEDEIGQLTSGFNHMLAVIQTRAGELRESEARFRATLDRLLEGCQIVDRDWRFVYVNDTAAAQARRPKEQLLGHSMLDCYPDIDAMPMFQTLRECMENGTVATLESEFVFADGSSSWFESSVQPVPEGILILSLDITARHLSERILLDARDMLEQKVAERTAELKVAKELAESSDRLKSEFLATMSHELRTPLNAIIGFTGTLLMKLPGPLNADQEKQLRTVQMSAKHLLSLINDLLDMAKIESGKLELNIEPIACQRVVDEVISALQPAAANKALTLRARAPAFDVAVLADRRALSQVLINLTNNAIKFTERGSVTLEVSDTDAHSGMVALSVIDTGAGISEADQKKLFQSFAQIDSGSKRRVEGTGLGLYLSRKLTELLGGRITLQSELNRGSRFTLLLPAARAGTASGKKA